MYDRRIAAVVLYMENLRGACARSFEAGNHFQMAISLLQSIPQALPIAKTKTGPSPARGSRQTRVGANADHRGATVRA
jgi:hypothetical protein